MLFSTIDILPLSTPIYLASLLAMGIAAQWVAWRVHIPAIILLLVFGFSLGYVAPPEEYIDTELLFPLVSLAVAIILFEGGLSLRFREIKETGRVVIALVTLGLAVTLAGTFLAAKWILGFSTPMALLCGTLLTVSGPTVVVPLLRHVRPKRRIAAVVKWEGIINDPIGAVLAALVFKMVAGEMRGGFAQGTAVGIALTILIGGTIGAIAAWLIVTCLKKFWVPDYLQNAFVLAIVLFVYALSNELQHEAGLVTVTVLGMILANQRKVVLTHIVEFKENLRVLLISTLFIVLAARVHIDSDLLASIGWTWAEFLWRGVAFLAVLVFFIRPVSVLVATLFGKINTKEKIFLAWIHPRGIVAAAVASLFALELAHHPAAGQTLIEKAASGGPVVGEAASAAAGYAIESQKLVLTTFLTIVGTVTLYGLSLAKLAQKLGIASQNPQGILFAGASPLVRQIALSLQNEGIDTLLVDTNTANIAEARMAGLPTFLANIGSEYAKEELDLAGIGRLLAMTPNDQVNAIAAMSFAEHLGKANVYQLPPPEASHERRETLHAEHKGRALFADEATYRRLASRIGQGATVKSTLLTEDFGYNDFLARYGKATLPLFIFDAKSGKLTVLATDDTPEPTPGQNIIALIDAME